MRAWEKREERTDRRFALIACVLANIHRGSDSEPYDVRDFVPMNAEQRAAHEAEKQRAAHKALAAALRAKSA